MSIPPMPFEASEKLLVLLRDGRKLLGILRSFDQFANAVLEGTCERVIVGEIYCDIPLGLYIIRGENVVLIGELDLDKEELPSHMTRVSSEEIKRLISDCIPLCAGAEGRKRSFGAQGYDEQEDGLSRYGLILMYLQQSSSSMLGLLFCKYYRGCWLRRSINRPDSCDSAFV
ncbi:hypothetical protein SASPL_106865 [Salvia splendens]|uniref:U6 snRNA-associated Sm-like protein LSm1 n=1 Tax=Salvia splendens TaxID=180675 RepID=A0A8X8YAC1_SALSN|nr:hypothetical protein SASPL_106865 [Salvia splendens]